MSFPCEFPVLSSPPVSPAVVPPCTQVLQTLFAGERPLRRNLSYLLQQLLAERVWEEADEQRGAMMVSEGVKGYPKALCEQPHETVQPLHRGATLGHLRCL
jgi:hypothetical protein